MKKLFLFLLLSALLIHASAQSSVKGTVTDSVEKKNPDNAVVLLMRTSDSVLLKFSRTDRQGNFILSGLSVGRYILMVTHPYMGDYFDQLDVPGGVTDLGTIYMTPKSKLLADVIVRTGSPIRIKGDTTIYTADSFKVRPGANVEELLRRLPGIQVDKDGKITAMGERVTKVLVDGEEFFGSDPGIATKNLRADAVKTVEVFDKKSEQAEFTGIDDGIKDKTINLKMKEKKGYFGKLEAGGGLRDKFNNAAMINSFKGKRKLAAYGIMSNTGQTNLDWEDAEKYGGGMDNVTSGITEDGGMWISITTDADENFWGGRNGIPKNWNGGLHYSNKFGKDEKQGYNTGYKLSKVDAPMKNSSFSRTFLPDSSWLTNSTSNSFNTTEKHALNLTFDLNPDSANSLKWAARANMKKTRNSSDYHSETWTESSDPINNSTRNSNNQTDNSSFSSGILWKHKFKKLYRTLSANTDFTWNHTNSDGLLYAVNHYFTNAVLTTTDSTDQQNLRHSEGKGITTKLAFTEPLAKDFYLELSYALAYNVNDNERITNRKSSNGKYEDRVDSLSNAFAFNRTVHTPGLNFRVNKKKYNYSFGASAGFSNFVQENLTEETITRYHFTNFFPRFSLTYKFKPSYNLRFNYDGSTSAPTLEQLQPVRVNTDPLNIYIGNPGLKQAIRHRFSANYSSYNVLKEKFLWTNIAATFTRNEFVQSSIVDSVGKRTYQTVNANGVQNFYFFGDYGLKLGKSKIRMGIGPTGNLSRQIEYINNVKNTISNVNYGVRLSAEKSKENKYGIQISHSITWNRATSSVNNAANARYWEMQGRADAHVILPLQFELGTEINTQIRQKDSRFTQNSNFTNWNASVTKRFTKENRFELSLKVYDILNQNKGYQRNFGSYSFTENYFTTLQRFWLLTFTWNISQKAKNASGI